MKKIMGLMVVLVGTAALAVPAMANCVGVTGYYGSYPEVRREMPVRHEVRRDVRNVRDARAFHGSYERR